MSVNDREEAFEFVNYQALKARAVDGAGRMLGFSGNKYSHKALRTGKELYHCNGENCKDRYICARNNLNRLRMANDKGELAEVLQYKE